MIIPRVQHEAAGEGRLSFGSTVKYYAADHLGHRAAALFRHFLPTVCFIQVSTRDEAQLTFDCRHDISRLDEFYKITAAELPVAVHYRDFLGARNAVASLAQLFYREDGEVFLSRTQIFDYPDTKMRSFMVDPARGLVPMGELKDLILRLAMAKYNYLHLHLSDSEGYAIKSDVVKFSGSGGRQYTKDEIRHLVAYALDMGIEIIPEVDFPGHGCQLIKDMPSLACVTDGSEEPSPWTVCAGNEEVYEVFEKIYTELAELFPCHLMHVGTDEIEMNDLTEQRTWPTWHCCSRCRALCEREGIDQNNRTEIFYYMLRRIYAIINKLGKRMMLWNDDIDISKSPELPRDVLIHFWRVAMENRGPREGCSMQRFLEEGFEVFNSDYPETYIESDKYKNNDESIFIWHPTATPPHDEARNGQIIGGEPCVWGDRWLPHFAHFEWSIPASVFMYGDRLWNRSVCEDRHAFGLAATRFLFGIDMPRYLDLFDAFGGFMQPRSEDGARMWQDRAAKDLGEVRSALATVAGEYSPFARLAAIYLDSVRWLENRREGHSCLE